MSTLLDALTGHHDEPPPADVAEVALVRAALDDRLAGSPLPATLTKRRIGLGLLCGGYAASGGERFEVNHDSFIGKCAHVVLAYFLVSTKRDGNAIIDIALAEVLSNKPERDWW